MWSPSWNWSFFLFNWWWKSFKNEKRVSVRVQREIGRNRFQSKRSKERKKERRKLLNQCTIKSSDKIKIAFSFCLWEEKWKTNSTRRCAALISRRHDPRLTPFFIFILPLRAWHFFLMEAPDPLPLAFIIRSRHERFFFFLQEECFVFPYCRGGATYSHASWEMLTSKLWTTVAPLFYGTLNAFVFFFSSLLFLFASFNERRSFPIWCCLLLWSLRSLRLVVQQQQWHRIGSDHETPDSDE